MTTKPNAVELTVDQAWQAQWNQAMEQLVLSYRAMAGTHENNTTSMLARDQAEGAKWGG